MTETLMTATRRVWRDDMDAEQFAVLTSTLCDGFLWLRRFEAETAPTSIYVNAWEHLFEAFTRSERDSDDLNHRERMSDWERPFAEVTPSAGHRAELDAIVTAAADLFVSKGYEGLTLDRVSAGSGLPRATVRTYFPYRKSLSAAVWASYSDDLRLIARDALQIPFEPALRSILAAVAARTRRSQYLVFADFIEVVAAYTVRYGRPQDNLCDPRAMAPMPELLVPVLERLGDGAAAGRQGPLRSRDDARELPDEPRPHPAGGDRRRPRRTGDGDGGAAEPPVALVEGSDMVRLATLPSRHAYVDAVVPPSVARPDLGRADLPEFGPDPLWDPSRLAHHLGQVDVVHVHFGFDHVEVAALDRWCAQLASAGVRLVVTVHDLRNPHHADPRRHEAHLRVLMAHAGAVLTLTGAAAQELARSYGVAATVVPHPAVFAGPSTGVRTGRGLVGIPLKSLRANLVDVPAVLVAADAGARAAGGRLEVTAHHDVAERLAGYPVPVTLHDRLSDEGLRAVLTRLHVLVLAQRFGTHSGLLEACRDVGTAVVAPSAGCYGSQWDAVRVYDHDEASGLSPDSLTAAVVDALAVDPPAPVDRAVRRGQQQQNWAVHAAAYGPVGRAAARAS